MPLRVVLLSLPNRATVFYSEESDLAPASTPESPGRIRRLRDRILDSERTLGPRTRRALDWLRSRMFADESVLNRLRGAREIVLLVPGSIAPDEATACWAEYLRTRRRRHLSWSVIDFITALGCFVLSPVPGPNVIQYWLFHRAYVHFQISRAVGAARVIESPSVRVEPVLEVASDTDIPAAIARISECFGWTRLADFADRVEAESQGSRLEPCAS
ncbi:MAG: hypothetical protein SFX72_20765 [Isosphaeraceae bacterium]|nr:hypothetical protein [Isosphaeraceae bacterium]